MDVVSFDRAELSASFPGERTDSQEPGLQYAQENFGGLVWARHRTYLKGRSRIEVEVGFADCEVTKTSIIRPSSAAART